MASDKRHLDDSSGDNPVPQLGTRKKHPVAKLQDLELKPILVQRDSGCYTGSPMTGNSLRPDRFTFEGQDESSGPSTSTDRWSRSIPPAILGMNTMSNDDDEDDEEDDVFHQSVDSFIDSGLQSMSLHMEDGNSRRGQSLNTRAHFMLYRQEEEGVYDKDSDEDSSTASEEFSTAEMNIGEYEEGVVSKPIDIPARSNNSSPVSEDDVFRGATSTPYRQMHRTLPPLERRATVGQFGFFGRGEEDSEAGERNLVEGAHGPLPDVVLHSMGRPRAMSESAIASQFHLHRVGSQLQMISDQFSDATRQKHLNLQQMRQRNLDRGHQGNSYPEARRKSSGFFAQLFSSSQE